jgi:hypothetical protein
MISEKRATTQSTAAETAPIGCGAAREVLWEAGVNGTSGVELLYFSSLCTVELLGFLICSMARNKADLDYGQNSLYQYFFMK